MPSRHYLNIYIFIYVYHASSSGKLFATNPRLASVCVCVYQGGGSGQFPKSAIFLLSNVVQHTWEIGNWDGKHDNKELWTVKGEYGGKALV